MAEERQHAPVARAAGRGVDGHAVADLPDSRGCLSLADGHAAGAVVPGAVHCRRRRALVAPRAPRVAGRRRARRLVLAS